MISGCGLSIDRQSDIILTSADNMFTDPIGICDEFRFRIGKVGYITKVYVVKKASFQLLLGNEFMWKFGMALFPRWGAVMISLPTFQVVKGSCERISADKAPPPLVWPSTATSSAPSPAYSSVPPISAAIDPLSGIPLEPAPFSYFDTRECSVPFLKISVSPTVGKEIISRMQTSIMTLPCFLRFLTNSPLRLQIHTFGLISI